ncbi:MAG: hypothetical protein ACKO0N_10000, partial [Planctomycetota bacterium]
CLFEADCGTRLGLIRETVSFFDDRDRADSNDIAAAAGIQAAACFFATACLVEICSRIQQGRAPLVILRI